MTDWRHGAGLLSGVCVHVPDHDVRVVALDVQVGVRVVLRDAPHAVTLVPESRPRQVPGQERRHPGSIAGAGRLLTSVMTLISVHPVHLVLTMGHLFHLTN
jgi:hypothetical protein